MLYHLSGPGARRVALASFLVLVTAGAGQAGPIVGLTSQNRLVFFDSDAPGVATRTVNLTGLHAGESLVGIDFRPATPNVLVGVGRRADNAGAIYTINTTTGAVSAINTVANPPGFNGVSYGVDFNPVPNALRIVNDADQNFRITAGGAGVVNNDGTLNPGNPNIVAAAYSNNVPGGIGGRTTLYVIDSVTDQLLTQGSANFPPGTSPNTGTLFPIGALGVDTGDAAGFDITSAPGLFPDAAFAALTVNGVSGLYSVNLTTGQATARGAIGGLGNGEFITGIAITQVVPEPGTLALLGAGGAALLLVRRRRGTA